MKKTQNSRLKTQSLQKGFTLLLAAIVSSIVLSLGAAIFSIALKQLTLASTGKNSQFAFYAADTAAECALYWDVRREFATSSSSSVDGSISCNEAATIPKSIVGTPTATAATTSFQYEYVMRGASVSRHCVNVVVAKYLNPTTSGISTTIHADGYSTPCSGITTALNALQRSVELRY